MTRNIRSEEGLHCKLAGHMESPFFQAEVQEMLRLAQPVPDSWLLDIGCGGGGLISAALSCGLRMLGMDISRETLQAAKSLSASDGFLQAAAEGIPFRSESLDAIFVQHVIEHLHDPVRACLEWNRALRTGARLVVVTPNARYPDPSIYEDPTHIHIFDPRTLRTLLVKTGYEVDTIETIFPYLKQHTVFGLRRRRLFSALPLWSRTGRSLVVVARKTGRQPSTPETTGQQ